MPATPVSGFQLERQQLSSLRNESQLDLVHFLLAQLSNRYKNFENNYSETKITWKVKLKAQNWETSKF